VIAVDVCLNDVDAAFEATEGAFGPHDELMIVVQDIELFFALNPSMDRLAPTVAHLITLYDPSTEDHVIMCASGMCFHV
jgi:hypothetical protein